MEYITNNQYENIKNDILKKYSSSNYDNNLIENNSKTKTCVLIEGSWENENVFKNDLIIHLCNSLAFESYLTFVNNHLTNFENILIVTIKNTLNFVDDIYSLNLHENKKMFCFNHILASECLMRYDRIVFFGSETMFDEINRVVYYIFKNYYKNITLIHFDHYAKMRAKEVKRNYLSYLKHMNRFIVNKNDIDYYINNNLPIFFGLFFEEIMAKINEGISICMFWFGGQKNLMFVDDWMIMQNIKKLVNREELKSFVKTHRISLYALTQYQKRIVFDIIEKKQKVKLKTKSEKQKIEKEEENID